MGCWSSLVEGVGLMISGDSLPAEFWSNKRTLVTGTTGFLGSHLVRCLLSLGTEVGVLLRQKSNTLRIADLLSSLRVLYGDLTDVESLQRCLSEFRPDYLFHLAAAGVLPGASAETIMRVNVMGTMYLLEALQGHPPRRFIYAGSSFEYGEGQNMSEEHPLQPTAVYGASKVAADILVHTYGRSCNLPVVTVRPFTPYGPFEHPQRLIPHIILSALRGEDVQLTGGEQERDFVFVDDVVDGMLRAASLYEGDNTVFNLCGGKGIAVREVATRVLELMGNPVRALFGALPYRDGEMWHQSGNNSRAERLLGWKPGTSLEEQLRHTINWYRANTSLVMQLA